MYCRYCKVDKKNEDFSPHRRRCKTCRTDLHRLWLKNNRDRVLIYGKTFRSKHKVKIREYYKNWYARNGRNRSVDYREAIYEWRSNNPLKYKAHKILNKAVRKGDIVKSTRCSNCDSQNRLSGHHEDYNKPLDVLWLCSSCHKLKHSLDNETR